MSEQKDRIECAIRHIQTAADVDPWAAEIAVEAMRNIQECGSCNDCGLTRTCKVRPLPGQMVRYNCPFWTKEDDGS